jgi:3-hydroxybutyryl-CoA dehydrogenase
VKELRQAAVVGSGTMGNGIAHVLALAGLDVALIDLDQNLLGRAMETIEKNLDRQAAKNAISAQDKKAAFGRIKPSTALAAAKDAQIAIEAVSENLEIKRKIFSSLDQTCPAEAILASNTSSISITALSASTRRPGKVIGMHFMNPVPVMKLVEIVRGLSTDDATCTSVRDLALQLGKTPVVCKDFPGFISNRILMPMINEACFVLMEGVAGKEDIDTVMKLGMNHPMGPLALADAIGLDVCLAIMEVLWRDFGDSKYRPCPVLRQMVQAGRLGRKCGHGFYEYPKN